MLIFISGCYSILILYHLLIYFDRRDDPVNLGYALFCIGYLIILNLSQNQLLIDFKENYVHIYESTRIFSIILVSWATVFLFYTAFNLKHKVRKMLLNSLILTLFGIIVIIIMFFKKDTTGKHAFYIWSIVNAVIILSFPVKAVISAKQYSQNKKIIILGGVLWIGLDCIALSIINSFSHASPPVWLDTVASLIFFLAFASVIAQGFNQEHKDLIELKNSLEIKVNDRTRELEVEKVKKTNFFVNFAHETKTSLTLIKNYLDSYIKTKDLISDVDLKIIHDNFVKLERDMVNFLDLEKIDHEDLLYQHQSIIDLSRLLENKAKMFQLVAHKKKIRIEKSINQNIFIRANGSAVDRIFNNVLDNALKFTQPEGMISIILQLLHKKIEIIISDNGCGIPQEQLIHVFDPYFKISQRENYSQGIGMGLFIVKNIIDSLQGKINIESNGKQGTTVYITLNRYDLKLDDQISLYNQEFPRDISVLELEETAFNSFYKNIMIVEDNLPLLMLLFKELKTEYNVNYALNGVEALQKLGKTVPDIIISDVMMNEMDGFSFIKNIPRGYKNIPFIFVTAKTTDEDKVKGLGLGAIDYIYKPFSIEELKQKIKNHIQKNIDIEQNVLNNLMNNIKNYQKNDQQLAFNDLCQNYRITKTETNVILLIKKGLENKEIARFLNISERTVNKHISNIYAKTSSNNRIELLKKMNFII